MSENRLDDVDFLKESEENFAVAKTVEWETIIVNIDSPPTRQPGAVLMDEFTSDGEWRTEYDDDDGSPQPVTWSTLDLNDSETEETEEQHVEKLVDNGDADLRSETDWMKSVGSSSIASSVNTSVREMSEMLRSKNFSVQECIGEEKVTEGSIAILAEMAAERMPTTSALQEREVEHVKVSHDFKRELVHDNIGSGRNAGFLGHTAETEPAFGLCFDNLNSCDKYVRWYGSRTSPFRFHSSGHASRLYVCNCECSAFGRRSRSARKGSPTERVTRPINRELVDQRFLSFVKQSFSAGLCCAMMLFQRMEGHQLRRGTYHLYV